MTERDRTWNPALDARWYSDNYVKVRGDVADAAKVGDFSRALDLLHDVQQTASDWRLGGSSWFTPLHQAAWHGARTEVADELLWLGAYRSQPDSHGRLPADVAKERGHQELARFLQPRPHPTDPEHLRAIESHLHTVVLGRTREIDGLELRPVPVAALIELRPAERLWVPIPGMVGGFALRWEDEAVVSRSWSRAVGGSGQEHRITCNGAELTEEGFV